MEGLLLVLEVIGWIADIFMFGADVHSWLKGKENRLERKEARVLDIAVPPRDRWNRRVIVLTLAVVALTAVLLTLRS
jgi:hypothetical protein